MLLPYVVGIVVSIGLVIFARSTGFDRDRAFYPTVLIVVASYYVLFAVMGDTIRTVILESVIMVGFALAAVAGFRSSMWIVVAGLAAHGVFDLFVHGRILDNAGVPAWWPGWCLSFDVGASACVAWLLNRGTSMKPAPQDR